MSLFSFFTKAEAEVTAIWHVVATMWPVVDTFVKQVEAAMPEGTSGAEKLAKVRTFLEAGWTSVNGVVDEFEQAWPTLSALITPLVALYNTVGLFKHKSSTTPAA